MLFLGCAAEDSEIASVIAAWLSEHMPETVQLWRPGESALTINAAEEHVSQAHAYIVLLSPDFLTAPLCRRERELAMCREQGLRLYFPAGTFVHVLLVRETDQRQHHDKQDRTETVKQALGHWFQCSAGSKTPIAPRTR